MTSASRALQNLLIFGTIIPLAIFAGYVLAAQNSDSYTTSALMLGAIFLPAILRWHHPLLVASLQMTLMLPLPGNPPVWLFVAICSLGMIIVRRSLGRGFQLQNVASVTAPLLFLAVVVLVTTQVRGGLSLGSLGGQQGGAKRVVFVLGAIIAYFALSSVRIPEKQARFSVIVFLLGGLTYVVGTLVPYIPSQFYFIYRFFPPDVVGLELVGGEIMRADVGIGRFQMLSAGLTSVVNALMAWYGLRRLLNLTKPWLTVLFIGTFTFSMLGGFRSSLIVFALMFSTLFLVEGLLKTRWTLIILVAVGLMLAVVSRYATHLPMSFQRVLTVLPIEVNPLARLDAQASSEWRLRIWRMVWPDVPRYFWFGKGFVINQADLQALEQLKQTGFDSTGEISQVSGDYHNGPFSVIIPLGIWGVLGVLWFWVAAIRVLWLNCQGSPAELLYVNRFLFAAFVSKMIFFVAVFGSLYAELVIYTGLIGLSVSINGGVRRPGSLRLEAPPVDDPGLVQVSSFESQILGSKFNVSN